MYRMELALIIVMGVNDLHARFIRLLYFYMFLQIYNKFFVSTSSLKIRKRSFPREKLP
jgi:hypothetical protein